VPETSGPAAGLDRRGSVDAFVTIIQDGPACFNTDPAFGDDMTNVVAHEVGHLFGAGHDLAASAPGASNVPVGWYLFSDSHATANELTIPFVNITLRLKTAVARADSHLAMCTGEVCLQLPTYSNSAAAGQDNAATIDWTAASVANYRPVPAACGLTKPTNVSGFVTTFCALFQPEDLYMTQHFIQWDDACPAETDYFTTVAVAYNPTIPPGYGSTIFESTFFRSNYTAQIYVSACAYGQGCTDWSSSSYYAPFLCNFYF